jgi:hypothetical protein
MKVRGLRYQGKPCVRGHGTERYVANDDCVTCAINAQKKYKGDGSAKFLRRMRRLTPDGWAVSAFHEVKKRSRRRGWELGITVDDLAVPACCPFLGTEFVFGHFDFGPSVDRIDSSKGYVKGNVQVISNKANRIKSDATLDDLIVIGRAAALLKESGQSSRK